jgi:hypothetical protein
VSIDSQAAINFFTEFHQELFDLLLGVTGNQPASQKRVHRRVELLDLISILAHCHAVLSPGENR